MHSQCLLESYQIINAINASQDYADYVFLENRKPKGLEHFYGLLYAIKNNKIIKIAYKKFTDNEASEKKLLPRALKEAKDRWYLIAEDTQSRQIKIYGLDRIGELEITKTHFRKSQY